MVHRYVGSSRDDRPNQQSDLFAMAFQIEIITIFAAVEQKTWEVAQRLKGKSFWLCVDAHSLFVLRVFSRFKPFSIRSNIIYHRRNKNPANRIFRKNNFAATETPLLSLQP